MVLLPTKEDFSQSSGIIPFANMELIYEGLMDNALDNMGRTITLHLEPSVEQRASVISNPIKRGSYNPFLGTSARPDAQGVSRGVEVTPRDIQYKAHISHGPRDLDDDGGIGTLETDQVQTTTVYESLNDITSCLSATIDGERYSPLRGPKITGFTVAKYIIQIWERINEEEQK